MKKTLSILLIASLVAAFAVSSAGAQLTYESGFQVANLSTTDTASIVITYYPQGTGSPVAVSDSIPAGESKTYFPIHSAAGDPFNGSVVVSSDQPVAAIANTLANSFAYGASTGGFSAGATSFSLPLIMCNNSGFNTWFNIQNAGSADASVTINYTAGLAGTSGSENATISPGRALTFDQASGSSTVNCDTLMGTDTMFVGSAAITSDQPVVATVMQVGTGSSQTLLGYNGFAAGSADVRVPLIMANNSTFFTGLQIQNAGTASANVTVDYSPNTASGSTKELTDDTFTLAAGESKTILHNGDSPANGGSNSFSDGLAYIGGATITSDGEPLVAIVNQLGGGRWGTAYEGFNAGDATTDVSVPLLMANNSYYFTGLQCANVGSASASVTVEFSPNTVGTIDPVDVTYTLAAGASNTLLQNGSDGTNDWDAIGQYVGSASVTATGSEVVCIVNQLNTVSASGDTFFTYDGFSQ